eukprot:INCI17273.2.p1 GENE.INCI17273.2~~INCI17273.2.p1  ORF type:complete len:533 (-),score=100.47 INCI17273.2:26-1624(-)
MALHTRERLHQVQAREQALRTAQVNSATPSSSTVGHNAAESVQEALELQRAEGAAAMQAFQTALLSRVDDGFLKVEASLRDYLKGLMSEHVVNEQHHRAETAKQLEDRLCRKLEERALDFAQGQFRMLQESVRQNQLALQQLYAQTAQRALVASSQHDMEGSSTGTTGGAQSPQAMLYMEQECKPSAAEAGSSPNASFLLEGPSASPFLDAEQEDDSVVVPPASQARIDQSSEDEMLLLRAKEQELRHLESRLRLKENHLLALQEELDERSKGRNDSDSDSVAANDTDTTGMEQGGQAQNSMKEIQLTPPLQLVHGRSASDTGTPAITSRGSGADILLPFQQRSEMSADYDEAGLTRRIDAHDTHRGGDDTDDDDVTPVKGLPVSTEVDSSDSDAKRAVKTTAGPQDMICEFCNQHGHLVGSNLAENEAGASSTSPTGPRILFCPELTSRQWTREDVLGAVPQYGDDANMWRTWVQDNINRGCDLRLLMLSLTRFGFYSHHAARDESDLTINSKHVTNTATRGPLTQGIIRH